MVSRNRSYPDVVYASPAYLAAHGEPRNVEELKSHDCVGRVSYYVIRK
jgi:hypothetical protein